MKPKRCPKCGSENIQEIVYGLPTEEFAESEEAKKYYFAGCIVTDDDPRWICLNRQCSYLLDSANRRKIYNEWDRKSYDEWKEHEEYKWKGRYTWGGE